MAIPFVVPSEEDNNHSEAELEQLLCDLIDINQQIQILLRARMQNRSAYMTPRVCTSPRHTSRHQTISGEVRATMPDLVSNLPLSSLPAANSRTDFPVSTIRPRRQRTTSESSCCDHDKITAYMDAHDDDDAITVIGGGAGRTHDEIDWSQVGVIIRQIAPDFTPAVFKTDGNSLSPLPSSSSASRDKSMLSKLLPSTTSSRSIWTAVICVVGWQIFHR